MTHKSCCFTGRDPSNPAVETAHVSLVSGPCVLLEDRNGNALEAARYAKVGQLAIFRWGFGVYDGEPSVPQQIHNALVEACQSAEDFMRDRPENSSEPSQTVLAKLRAALMIAGSGPR